MKADQLVRLARVRELAASGGARMIRVGAGVSLREAAAAIDVPVTTLWRWETGERAPRATAAALRYADLLETLATRNRPRRGGDAAA